MGIQSQPADDVAAPSTRESPSSPGILCLASSTLTGTFGSLLFLAPLAFIFDLVGYVPPYVRLFFVYGLLALPLCRLPRDKVLRGAAVLVGVAVVNAIFPLPLTAEVPLLTFAHLWIWSVAGLASGSLLQGVFFYMLLYLYLFASPLGYAVLERLTALTTKISVWITGSTVHLGYTYQNLGGILLFLSLSLHGWDRSAVSKFRTGGYLLVALLLNGLLSAILVHQNADGSRFVDIAPDLMWELIFRDLFTYKELGAHSRALVVLVFPGIVFLAQALSYLILHHDVRRAPDPETEEAAEPGPVPARRMSLASIGFAVAAVGFVLLILPPMTGRPATASPVVMLNKGVVSYTKPAYGRYGRGAAGMYGFFPDYAGLFGCPAEVVTEIPDRLDPAGIFVMPNVDFALTPEEFKRIWAFVRDGGGLWVLGDHTFIKNGRNHINDLLEPTHIRFNHDSAQLIPQGWFHALRTRQANPFADLRGEGENRMAILVGASLDLAPPARPLIIGRFGYGDLGPEVEDPERGWIGDFEYQNHERLGDLVLVAGEQVGKGKVLVFGDTTSFFNNNMSRTYELLRAVLTWFGEPAWTLWFHSRTAGLLAAVALAAMLVFSVVSQPAAAVLPLLALLAVLSFAVHRPTGRLPIDRDMGRERIAIVDFSHHPYASKHGNMNTGLYGLSMNLMRHDLMPIIQNTWDRDMLDAAALLVLQAPREPLTRFQRRDVMRFMERGGTVLVACGYPHSPGSRGLLNPLGLRVGNIPLGRFFDRPALNLPVQYFSAWPIEVNRPDATVLSTYDAWPLMVSVPVGDGRMVLIADSEFLHNFNLESLDRYSIQNIEFVRALLDYVMGGPPS